MLKRGRSAVRLKGSWRVGRGWVVWWVGLEKQQRQSWKMREEKKRRRESGCWRMYMCAWVWGKCECGCDREERDREREKRRHTSHILENPSSRSFFNFFKPLQMKHRKKRSSTHTLYTYLSVAIKEDSEREGAKGEGD
jgi:hypothetical protein